MIFAKNDLRVKKRFFVDFLYIIDVISIKSQNLGSKVFSKHWDAKD